MSSTQSVVILFILTGMLFSQPDTLWTKTYGGSLWDYGWDVYELSNKDLLIIGSTASFGAGYYDVYLLRTDSLGDTIWIKRYGTSDNESPWASCKAHTEGYYITGCKGLGGSGSESAYLFKTNENGDSLWVRTYFAGEPTYSWHICPTTDDNYLLGGSIGTLGGGNEDAYIIKVNENGETLWTWRYDKPGSQRVGGVCNSFDGDYLVAVVDTGVCFIKMTPNGDTLWSRRHDDILPRICVYICPTLDGNYMTVGYIGEYGSGQEDIYLLKVNENGDSLWAQTYGGDDVDYGQHIYETPDTNYFVVGWTRSFGANSGDVYLFKIDKDGNLLWDKRYGGNNLDAGCKIRPTTNGGYLITGFTMSYGAGLADIYLIRLGQELGITEDKGLINNFLVSKIYPNPMTESAIIQFVIKREGLISLKIYNALGHLVRRLINNEIKTVGGYTVKWNCKDELEKRCPSGIYFVYLESEGGSDVTKIILVH